MYILSHPHDIFLGKSSSSCDRSTPDYPESPVITNPIISNDYE